MAWPNGKGLVLALMVTMATSQQRFTPQQYAAWVRIAARAGDANYVNAVLASGIIHVDSADINGFSPLHWAARFGRANVANVLVNTHNADVNLKTNAGETPLMSAAIGNFVEVGQILIDNNADVNLRETNGYTALVLAARFGHLNFTKFALDNGADISIKTNQGQSALMWAALGNFDEITTELIDRGADIDERDIEGYTSLIWAARLGQTEAVRTLIASGANVNIVTNTGDTALMWGALGNYIDIVKDLLDNGAEINQQEDDGWTALMGASVQGHEEMVTLLLEQNAIANITNSRGHTALIVASATGQDDVVDILSDENTGDINIQDIGGMSSLIHAAANNFTFVFRVIAYKCPNISLRDSQGKTAMDYAVEFENPAAIALLKIMAYPTCMRFGQVYKEGEIIHQDCELLRCHCTGVWRFTGEKDTGCGKGQKQILTLQRAVNQQGGNHRQASHLVQ